MRVYVHLGYGGNVLGVYTGLSGLCKKVLRYRGRVVELQGWFRRHRYGVRWEDGDSIWEVDLEKKEYKFGSSHKDN